MMHQLSPLSVWPLPSNQIIDHGLPTKPVKATQSQQAVTDISQTVEAEAMPPAILREIVRLLPLSQWLTNARWRC